jgi:hypothetical protein
MRNIPSGSNCVDVIVVDGKMYSSGFLDACYSELEDWVRAQRPVGTSVVGAAFLTLGLSLLLLLLLPLLLGQLGQPCGRVSGFCARARWTGATGALGEIGAGFGIGDVVDENMCCCGVLLTNLLVFSLWVVLYVMLAEALLHRGYGRGESGKRGRGKQRTSENERESREMGRKRGRELTLWLHFIFVWAALRVKESLPPLLDVSTKGDYPRLDALQDRRDRGGSRLIAHDASLQ